MIGRTNRGPARRVLGIVPISANPKAQAERIAMAHWIRRAKAAKFAGDDFIASHFTSADIGVSGPKDAFRIVERIVKSGHEPNGFAQTIGSRRTVQEKYGANFCWCRSFGKAIAYTDLLRRLASSTDKESGFA